METRKQLEELLEYLSSPCPNANCTFTAPNHPEKCYVQCTMFDEAKKRVRELLKKYLGEEDLDEHS